MSANDTTLGGSPAPASGSNVPGEGQEPAGSSPGAVGGTVDETAGDGATAPANEPVAVAPLSIVPPTAPAGVASADSAADVASSVAVADEVVDAAEVVSTSALEALAQSKAANPHFTFAEHLKAVADKGLAAVLNPADESAVLGAVVQVLKEVLT